MSIPLRVFRVVRAAGPAGCEHHVLLRAGRPSAPGADQGAEDAADALPDALMDALTAWWRRWVLPAHCPGPEHEVSVLADPVEVVGPGPLHDDTGMRPLDVWLAPHRDRPGAVLGAAADLPSFLADAEDETDGALLGEPVRLRVLLLAEGSGDGDLRDL